MLKADDARYEDADLIALTNNGLLYLFNSLKLTLAGQEVEHVNYPGHATSLLCLTSYSLDYQRGCGVHGHKVGFQLLALLQILMLMLDSKHDRGI